MANKPFFVPKKEITMIDAINTELIDEIAGQVVDIYKVSVDNTETNVYGEAVGGGTKTFRKGYRVNCLILFNDPEVEMTDYGTDNDNSIEIYFHRNSLDGTGFYPEVGDIVDWRDIYFEMNGVTEPQLLAGHPEFKHDVKCTANRIRLSSINLEQRVR